MTFSIVSIAFVVPNPIHAGASEESLAAFDSANVAVATAAVTVQICSQGGRAKSANTGTPMKYRPWLLRRKDAVSAKRVRRASVGEAGFPSLAGRTPYRIIGHSAGWTGFDAGEDSFQLCQHIFQAMLRCVWSGLSFIPP